MIGLYTDNETVSGVVYSYDNLYGKTFAPVYQTLILDTVKGKTYAEKREFVRNRAIDYSNMFCTVRMSYWDLAQVQEWFERYGKRYGLLQEFRENGVI